MCVFLCMGDFVHVCAHMCVVCVFLYVCVVCVCSCVCVCVCLCMPVFVVWFL